MEQQIWVKSEEKWATILMLRGDEVSRLKVTGNFLTLKRKVQGVLEALEQGQGPSDVGVKSVETLNTRAISKAELSPGNSSLTLHGDGESSKSLAFSAPGNSADEIFQAILARSGRTFQPTQKAIGVFEALIPPAILGAIGGLFWMGIYQAATDLASGKVVEVQGGRRQGLKKLLIGVADFLGTSGTIGVGVVLLALVLGWAATRIVHRPERTVWLPANA